MALTGTRGPGDPLSIGAKVGLSRGGHRYRRCVLRFPIRSHRAKNFVPGQKIESSITTIRSLVVFWLSLLAVTESIRDHVQKKMGVYVRLVTKVP